MSDTSRADLEEAFAQTVVSAHPDYKPNLVDLEISKKILEINLNDGDALVTIFVGADDSSFIMWTDGINEWIEHYPSLAYSLGRLALLQVCAESTWEKGFTHTPRGFVSAFSDFLDVSL